MEPNTAKVVAAHLERLGFTVHSGIGGHGVAGVLSNGPGKTILMRAELDALPIQELAAVPYRSSRRVTDRYGNERPVMHACGHDMNMAALLASADLLQAAAHRWQGTLVVVFQPDEEETGGAQAMVNDGLYDRVPVPDVMLGQHVVAARAGTVAIRAGPVLMAADTMRIRVIGGPCHDSKTNPQACVDPIPLSMRIVSELQDAVTKEVGPHAYATVACWGFHAGEPGNDYVAHADVLLDIKTVDAGVRRRVLDVVRAKVLADARAAGVPRDPEINHTVRAPLTTNDAAVAGAVGRMFGGYFAADALLDMALTPACEDFSILGAKHDVPYAYWNFGGTGEGVGDADGVVPTNHSPYFAPEVDLTLKTGADAMALAALTFLVGEGEA
jgi:amidohydrolase